jgi:hypothetical protein
VPERAQRPADPGHHAVPASLGQPAGEEFEHAAPVGVPAWRAARSMVSS